MEIDKGTLIDQLRELPSLPSEFNPVVEAGHLETIIKGELSDFLKDYSEPFIAGAGGSGVVLCAKYEPFDTLRAIKIPRRRQYVSERPEDQPPEVDPEMQALSKVSHKNITRLYESKPLTEGKGFCYVTEYVNSPKPLHVYAKDLCTQDCCRQNKNLLGLNLRRLAAVIYEIVDAVAYMHDTAKLLHFDLKPDNILVSGDGRAFVTDLGFAREFTRYAPEDTVKIGFTWKYAHPNLTGRGAQFSQTQAKSKNEIPSTLLKPVIDLFAFGRTLQEVLRIVEREYGASIYPFYTFNYLHVVSCLCLDGRNAPNGRIDSSKCFMSDQALGMPIELFGDHAFKAFIDVRIALDLIQA